MSESMILCYEFEFSGVSQNYWKCLVKLRLIYYLGNFNEFIPKQDWDKNILILTALQWIRENLTMDLREPYNRFERTNTMDWREPCNGFERTNTMDSRESYNGFERTNTVTMD